MNTHSTVSQDVEATTESFPLLYDQAESLDQKTTKYSEFRWIAVNSIPVVGTYLLQNSSQVASLFVLGHLGSTELAAAAMGNMFATMSAWSVTLGASTALDTLCSQAWTGAHDKRMVGVYLQRGLLILSILYIPIACLWWNGTSILLALNQDPELARLGGLYLRYLLIGAPANIAYEAIKKYLQAQGIMHASAYVLLIVSPLNFAFNYLLVNVDPFRLGFIGAPLATSISYWTALGLLLLYIKYVNGWQAWGGWTRESLRGWQPFLRLAIPGIFMACSEWWVFEVAALEVSYIGSIKLAAHSILYTISYTIYSMLLGISVAASTRVGNAVGEGRPVKARTASWMAMLLAIIVASGNSTILVLTRSVIGYLFSSDPQVVQTVAQVLPVCAAFQIADGLTGVASGIFRGLGRQKLGAYINLFAYYILALPIGCFLAFKAGWGLSGVWAGLAIALYLAAIAQFAFLRNCDWDEEVKRNLHRLRNPE